MALASWPVRKPSRSSRKRIRKRPLRTTPNIVSSETKEKTTMNSKECYKVEAQVEVRPHDA